MVQEYDRGGFPRETRGELMRDWIEEKQILIGFVLIIVSAVVFSAAPIVF